MIYPSLSYSPKDVTLRKKFGNLPIKYIRMQKEKETELALFEKVLKSYSFNYEESEDEEKAAAAVTISREEEPPLEELNVHGDERSTINNKK